MSSQRSPNRGDQPTGHSFAARLRPLSRGRAVVRPDWICDVVSPGHAKDDTVKKLRLYHRVAVPHYWRVDPRDATLTVMRYSTDGYVTLLGAERIDVVRAEPFQEVELEVGTLFGDDPGS